MPMEDTLQNEEQESLDTEQIGEETPETPQTPPPSNRSIEFPQDYYQNAFRQSMEMNQQLQNRLNELESKINSSKPAEPAVDYNQTYYDKPADAIRGLVAQEVRPLNEFVASMRRDNEYSKLKAVYRNNPQIAHIFPQIEPHLDALVASNPNIPVTQQLLNTYITSVIGQIALNQLGNMNPNPPTNNPPTNNPAPITPPHLEQRSPRSNAPKQNDVLLTEEERKIARMYGLNPDTPEGRAHIVKLRDLPSDEFINYLNEHSKGAK